MRASSGDRSILAACALASALILAPAPTQAQVAAGTNNSTLRASAIIFIAIGGAGFLSGWLGFPFYVRDQHFAPCRGSCSDEFGAGFAPLAGPWIVLGGSAMVPAEGSVAFGLTQLGSLALGVLGVVMWGLSRDPSTGEPELLGLAPMLLPGGGGAVAFVTLE